MVEKCLAAIFILISIVVLPIVFGCGLLLKMARVAAFDRHGVSHGEVDTTQA